MKTLIPVWLALQMVFAAAWARDVPPPVEKGHRYAGSFYRLFEKKIYFGKPCKEGLLDADPVTFVVHGEKDFDFQYLTPMGADKNAFFLATKRIPFPDAHKAEVIAPNNNGDCMYLIVHDGRLFRINKNDKKVEPVIGQIHLESLVAIPTNNRYVAPLYFKDQNAVYFYDLRGNKLHPLPGANPKTFEGRAVQYGFDLFWGMDAKNVYAGYKRIDKAHRPTFEYVGWVYAKDKNHVYVISNTEWSLIPGADPASFSTVKGRGIDARDDKHGYSMGKRID
jgi:hypothetical protein